MWPFDMDHANFILLAWVLSLGATAVYARWVVRRGSHLAEHATEEEMPWT